MEKSIRIPSGTVINGISKDGEKIISEDFINLLPDNIRKNLIKVIELASKALGYSSEYLKRFQLGTGKRVSSILGKTEKDLNLQID